MSLFSVIFLQAYFTHYVPQIGKIRCQGKDTQPVVTVHSLAALRGGVTSTPHSLLSFRKRGSKGEGNEMEKGTEGSLTGVEQFPEGKAVASIRARERLSLFTKKLSRKYMEKVIWSICKNLSTFPFSSHSFTVWKLLSEETVLQGWQ